VTESNEPSQLFASPGRVAPPTPVPPSGPAPATGYGQTAAPVVQPWEPATSSAPSAAEYHAPKRPSRERRERRGMSAWWLAPLVVVSLVAGGAGGVLAERYLDKDRPVDAQLPVSPAAPVDRAPDSVAGIASTVLPSVVAIEVATSEGRGSGSGFILRSDGYILTNNHVVDGGSGPGGSITVVFADGTQETATLVGATLDYDLAVIKVPRSGLTPLALADSDAVVVGDHVIAIGAPLGLQGTVTSGIVSAVNRPVTAGDAEGQAFINAIQTDAAINPGNSGGPLLDSQGRLIGMNTEIFSPSGASAGIGFVIPVDSINRVVPTLIDPSGQMGVTLRTIPEEAMVMIDTVHQGSGAEAAGLRGLGVDGTWGDVIVSIDGKPVHDHHEVRAALANKKRGEKVHVVVLRGLPLREERLEFTVELR